MQIKPERLEQSLAGSLAPVYLVAGAEPLLVQESRDMIIAAAKREGYLERTVFEVNKGFDWEALQGAGMEQSLFSSRKISDLRLPSGKPGQAGGKILTDWAREPTPDVLLIVSCDSWDASSRKSRWAGEMAKSGVLVEIWPVKAHELPAWIERRMRAAGLTPERDAVALLAEWAEGNLLAAQQEIDKLTLLVPDGKVGMELVRQSAANSSRFDAFQLGECLLSGRAGDCLKVAASLQRTGVAIQAVSGALYYQLGQLEALFHAVHAGENEAQAFGRLRIFRMAQPAFRNALKRLSSRQIGDAFRSLALLDRQSKGRAGGDPWQTLDRMLLDLCAVSAGPRVARFPR